MVSGRVLRISFQNGGSLVVGLFVLTRSQVKTADLQPGVDAGGIQIHNLLQSLKSISPALHFQAGFRQLVIGFRVAGIDFQCIAELYGGFGIFPGVHIPPAAAYKAGLGNFGISAAPGNENNRTTD